MSPLCLWGPNDPVKKRRWVLWGIRAEEGFGGNSTPQRDTMGDLVSFCRGREDISFKGGPGD